MGAVDPDDLGAAAGKIGDDGGIAGIPGGERHHDPTAATGRGGTEDLGRMALEARFAAKELPLRRRPAGRRHSGKGRERHRHRIQRGQNPAFEPAERRQSERHQPPLERPQVMTPDSHVMRQVQRTRGEAAAADARPPAAIDRPAFGRHATTQGDRLFERLGGLLRQFRRDCHGGFRSGLGRSVEAGGEPESDAIT